MRKEISKISPEKKVAIVKNSVLAQADQPSLSATEMKKRFVAPIVDESGGACLADEIDRVAEETEQAFKDLEENKVSLDGNNEFTGENFFHNVTAGAYNFPIGTQIYSTSDGNVMLYANNGGIIATTDMLANLLYTRVEPIEKATATLEEKVKQQDYQIENLLAMQSKTVSVVRVEDLYFSRETAGGLSIVDGAYSTITKITGKTEGSRNLFYYDGGNYGSVNNGIAFTISDDGRIYANGVIKAATDTSSYFSSIHLNRTLKLKAGARYTISSNSTMFHCIIAYYDENGTQRTFGTWSNDGTYVSFTWNANWELHALYIQTATNKTGSDIAINNMQILPVMVEGDKPVYNLPYYKGLKNATILGVDSVSKNIFNTLGENNATGNSRYEVRQGAIRCTATNDWGGSHIFYQEVYPAGTYTFSAQSLNYSEFRVFFATDTQIDGTSFSSYYTGQIGQNCYDKLITNSVKYFTFTATSSFRVGVIFVLPGSITNRVCDIEQIQLVRGSEHGDFANYKVEESFRFLKQIELGEWDYALPQEGKIVRRTTPIYKFTGKETCTNKGSATTSGSKHEIFYYFVSLPLTFPHVGPSDIGLIVKGVNTDHADGINISDMGVYFGDNNNPSLCFWCLQSSDYWATKEDLLAWIVNNNIEVVYMTEETEEELALVDKSIYKAYEHGTEEIVGHNEVKPTIEQEYYVWINES